MGTPIRNFLLVFSLWLVMAEQWFLAVIKSIRMQRQNQTGEPSNQTMNLSLFAHTGGILIFPYVDEIGGEVFFCGGVKSSLVEMHIILLLYHG